MQNNTETRGKIYAPSLGRLWSSFMIVLTIPWSKENKLEP